MLNEKKNPKSFRAIGKKPRRPMRPASTLQRVFTTVARLVHLMVLMFTSCCEKACGPARTRGVEVNRGLGESAERKVQSRGGGGGGGGGRKRFGRRKKVLLRKRGECREPSSRSSSSFMNSR